MIHKEISLPVEVLDLTGLLIDLRKQGFLVANVSLHRGATTVYLHEEEEKDPTAIVQSWVGRPLPDPKTPREMPPPGVQPPSVLRRILKSIF